ncbi:MAG TPA: hypothetical protein VGE58_07255 [Daejeonella sp.]
MSEQAFTINQTVKIINMDRFARSYQDFLDGKTHFAEIDGKDFLFQAFDTHPLADFEAPEKFPYCCEWHERIYNQAREKFDEFPGCCEHHKKLIGQPWFNKIEYTYLPEKIVNTIAYTLHCIDTNASHENWYKEITDYVDYTVKSYGQFPTGYGAPLGVTQYLSCIESNVQDRESLNEIQKSEISKYIERLIDPVVKHRPADLNKLVDIYKQWLRVFPFNISYLSNLKSHFQRMLPILCGPFDTNIYTGLTSSKLISKKQLLRFLTDTTQAIIVKLNALEAFKSGNLSDREKTRIEIANARHQINLQSLAVNDKDSDKAYLKMIKKWLKHEKEYINELTEIFAEDYSTQTFILNVIDGMQQLQSGDTNEHCLNVVRNKGKDRESQIRYWFRNFLKARYKGSDVTAEEENGPGRMDLKVFHPNMGLKIIEFKGWWNADKKGVSQQLTNYLTDAQNEGFVFMINHLENRDITDDYKNLITNESLGFVSGSWQTRIVPNTAMVYHESRHKSATQVKTLYHFVLNVFY